MSEYDNKNKDLRQIYKKYGETITIYETSNYSMFGFWKSVIKFYRLYRI